METEDLDLIDKLIFMAQVAEQVKNYDEMVHYIKEIVKIKKSDFTVKERNLINVAFKSLIQGKRVIVRTIDSLIKAQVENYRIHFQRMNEYKASKEREIQQLC